MSAPLFTRETARQNAIKGNAARWAKHAARVAAMLPKQAQQSSTVILAQAAPVADSGASASARNRLITEVENQLRLLEKEPAKKIAQLGNGPDGEGRASLVRRLTDTAAQLHGWGSTSGTSMVVVGLVSSLDPDESRPAPGPEPAAIEAQVNITDVVRT